MTDKIGKRQFATSWSARLFGGRFPFALLVVSQFAFFELCNDWLKHVWFAITEHSCYSIEFYISLLFNQLSYRPTMSNMVKVCTYKTQYFKYYNFPQNGINLSNSPFNCLVNKISLTNIISLLHLLLLERKIILVQNDDSDIAVLIEGLLALLYPLYCLMYYLLVIGIMQIFLI